MDSDPRANPKTANPESPDSSGDDEARFAPAPAASGLRDRAWFLAKIGITVLLFSAILRTVDLSPVLARLAGLNPWLLGLALLLFALQMLLAAVRWGCILKVAETPLPTPLLVRFMTIAQFFNQAMVSTVGGDVVRVWMVGKAGGSYKRAAVGVLADRGFGVFALLLLVAGAWPLQERLAATATLGPIGIALVAVGICGFLGLAGSGPLLARHGHRWRPLRLLGDLALLLRRVLGHPAAAGGVLGASLAIHTLSVLAMKALSVALGLEIPLVALAWVVPVVLLLSIVPITIGGWGLRESLMITGLGFVGIPAADGLALSVLFGLGLTAIGIPGGLLWLNGRERRAAKKEAS